MVTIANRKKQLGNSPNISVVFSTTLALFVIGLFGLLMLHANQLASLVRENIEIQIFLDRNITENEQIKIQKTLATKDYVLLKNGQPRVSFISKEEAAQKFIKETGEDFIQLLGENPLRDAFVIIIRPEFYETEKLEEIKADIESLGGVFEVAYIESLIDSVNDNLAKISLVLMGFATLLVIVVIILINNTIRLALFSQRFLIRSMQLVGATSGFIRKPFLARFTFQGILSGILASVLLFLLLQYANRVITDLADLQEPEKMYMLFGFLIFLGGFLGLVSAYRSIKKYLKMSLDELF